MAFESLTDKLQNVFKSLRSKGTLTEADVKEAMKEVKRALLEADVNYKVVRDFTKKVSERAIGQEVMTGLNPGHMVIKIVKEEMDALMGSETTELTMLPANEITTIMMCGLQGAGKTTTAAKLAGKLKNKGKKPLLVACDIYRPAAIKQLQVNGEKQGVPVFTMGDQHKPVDIVKAAMEHASKNGNNVVIIDTAGRLHIDEQMMAELEEIRDNITLNNTLLTVDAMTGQDAVNVANSFNDQIGIDGVVLTKLDGDTRGGAALSIRAVTGKPILFIGMGEKLDDLEQFYPDRMASRILGMGDIESLIEKAQNAIDEDAAAQLEEKMKSKQGFGFDDYLIAMEQMNQMGGLTSMLSMMPGMGSQLKGVDVDDSVMDRPKAIILSMTPAERSNPDIINPSRKKRIASGAGVDVAEVNRMIKQFEQTKKMMKQMGLMGNGKGSKKKRRGGFPGMGGMPNMGGFPGLGGGKKFPF
ncbi:MAG: signal recognition particle protein [Lachnospiraceae bacterium]|nr:signal recognition particle protein [Lachnospiraceae bacterium]